MYVSLLLVLSFQLMLNLQVKSLWIQIFWRYGQSSEDCVLWAGFWLFRLPVLFFPNIIAPTSFSQYCTYKYISYFSPIFFIPQFLRAGYFSVFFWLRKFTFGNNGVEFTHDVLIKYQTMTCGFNIHLFGIQSKPSFLSGQTPTYSSWLCFWPEAFSCQGCSAPFTALSLTTESLWSSL